MITRVLSAGLIAGFVAGCLVAIMQHFTTTPLIVAAEQFEAAALHDAARLVSAQMDVPRLILVHSGHGHDASAEGESAWQPSDGIERTLYTSITTIATAIGFAFFLLAGLLVAAERIDIARALNLAAAGFVVTGLAPAFGLAPELPGMPAADLLQRQIWWLSTAGVTALALWLFFQRPEVWLKGLAVALIVAPHVVGAPHLAHAAASQVPAELAAQFAARSLAVHATLWMLTGLCVAWLWQSGKEQS